jgi:hypothetical protein
MKPSRQGRVGQLKAIRSSLFNDAAEAVPRLLPRSVIRAAVWAERVWFRDCFFTPVVTLWTFLIQVLSPDGSCRAAMSALLALVAVKTPEQPAASLPDAATGPYCKARKRLPERLVKRLALDSGRALHQRQPAGALLGGRPVKIVDGTTCSMPDTRANQKLWPQPPTQKKGLGFPLVRLVAVMSLSCAAVLSLGFGAYYGSEGSETALFRTLIDDLAAGDILLADRYFASYWMIALLQRRQVDSLFRQHQLRKVDFRKGKSLGRGDHVIVVDKPRQRPAWMDRQQYDALPQQLTVREVKVQVAQRGFRVRSMTLVTTLLDARTYSKEELARAFRQRWQVELDLRAIKQTMQMSVLRCKTPEMIRKEVWMHILAYNLIRGLMADAARQEGVEPRQISFAAAVQTVLAFAPVLEVAAEEDLPRLWQIMLRSMACHRVGDRPDRYEPRAVKRRAKPIALLRVTREKARAKLAKNGAKKR